MTGTAREMLTWAASQVRTEESPRGSNRQPYAALAGHADGQAWCGTFLVAGWKVNGVHLVAGTDTAYTPTMHTGFSRAGRLKSEPRAGDVCFQFHADLGRIAHVFLVERVEGDYVTTIEGNSNLDGGREGFVVCRHRRRWRGNSALRGFGRPLYAAPANRPTVSFSRVSSSSVANVALPDGGTTNPQDVRIVESALLAEGLLSVRYAKDGSFGSMTRTAYGQWQRRLGFTGGNADGIVGRESLEKLGARHGFVVVD